MVRRPLRTPACVAHVECGRVSRTKATPLRKPPCPVSFLASPARVEDAIALSPLLPPAHQRLISCAELPINQQITQTIIHCTYAGCCSHSQKTGSFCFPPVAVSDSSSPACCLLRSSVAFAGLRQAECCYGRCQHAAARTGCCPLGESLTEVQQQDGDDEQPDVHHLPDQRAARMPVDDRLRDLLVDEVHGSLPAGHLLAAGAAPDGHADEVEEEADASCGDAEPGRQRAAVQAGVEAFDRPEEGHVAEDVDGHSQRDDGQAEHGRHCPTRSIRAGRVIARHALTQQARDGADQQSEVGDTDG